MNKISAKLISSAVASLVLFLGVAGLTGQARADDLLLKPPVIGTGFYVIEGKTIKGDKEYFLIDPQTMKVKSIVGTSPNDVIPYYNQGNIPTWFGRHGVNIMNIYDYDTEYVLYTHVNDKMESGQVIHSHENKWSIPVR